MFNVTNRRDPAKPLSALIVRSAERIEYAVKHVRDPKAVAQAAREIKVLEEEGDAVYSDAVGRCFVSRGRPTRGPEVKELYDNRACAGRVRGCTERAESISLKNS